MPATRILVATIVSSLLGCHVGSAPGTAPGVTVSGAPPKTLAASKHIAAPNRDQWTLSFSDEFEGTELDSSKWSLGLPWTGTDGTNRHHNDQYASYIMDDDVSVSGGALHLTTQRRDVTGKNGRLFHFTQGFIITRRKFEQTYGYFEARLKFPLSAGPGLWPAFWTLSDGWPPEMDICEVWTSTMRRHQGSVVRDENGKQKWDSWNHYGPIDPGYTTWAMEWGPGYQIYSQNGVVTNRIYGAHVTDAWQYILLNSGVESGRPPTAQTVFPNSFDVDYVRVWARPDEPVILNGNFEAADEWPWSRYGRTAIVFRAGEASTNGARVDGGASAIEQTIFGLKPNTSYRVTARARQGSPDADARLGVKDFGADEISAQPTSERWQTVSVQFTTGPSTTSARIYCYVPADGGVGFFDNVTIQLVR